MKCARCDRVLPPSARFCPACGAQASVGTNVEEALAGAGKRAVEVTKKAAEQAKPVAKDVVRLTGRAVAKLGSLAKATGQRLESTSARPEKPTPSAPAAPPPTETPIEEPPPTAGPIAAGRPVRAGRRSGGKSGRSASSRKKRSTGRD